MLKLKCSTKGKRQDGKTIAGSDRLTKGKIKQLQRYYGLAIRQNILSKPNPTEIGAKVTDYTMKKNIVAALLKHNVEAFLQMLNIGFAQWEEVHGVNGNRIKPLVRRRINLRIYYITFRKLSCM